MPNPFINPETGKIYSWENPNFTPGENCTTCRYGVLSSPRFTDSPYTCEKCIGRIRKNQKGSASAKLAVQTKREKYTSWPTRKHDHKLVRMARGDK